jgi:hypothetical protein
MRITQDQARSILAWFEAYESELLHTTSGEYRFAERLAQYIGGLDEVAESYRRSAVDEAERETAYLAPKWEPDDLDMEWLKVKPNLNNTIAKILGERLGKK